MSMPLYNVTLETEPAAGAEEASDELLEKLEGLEAAGILEGLSGVGVTDDRALVTIFDVQAPNIWRAARRATHYIGRNARLLHIVAA
jgi:hypothetical protein